MESTLRVLSMRIALVVRPPGETLTDLSPIEFHGLQELLPLRRVISLVPHAEQRGFSLYETFSEFLPVRSKEPADFQYTSRSEVSRRKKHPLTTDKTPTSERNVQCGPSASAHPIWLQHCCYRVGRTSCTVPPQCCSVHLTDGCEPTKIQSLRALAIDR